MWHTSTVAVVIPAYKEERLIADTLRGLPAFVDQVYVVNDASPDDTAGAVRSVLDPRVELLTHETNRGVGGAIVTGYLRALERGADLLVVMAGDNQMAPEDLPALLNSAELEGFDYAKGNRFLHAQISQMPRLRRLGSTFLSWLTRLVSGLRVDDCQCGFTVLTASMARRLPLRAVWPRYGYPNDLLILLAQHGAKVCDVPVKPVYGVEKSGLRPYHVLSIAWRILRRGTLLHTPFSVTPHGAIAKVETITGVHRKQPLQSASQPPRQALQRRRGPPPHYCAGSR
jgi:glycosyltransferase involved in cell wall biosynthesis